MSTLLCFHAHPDDESLSTGGLMAKAAKAGHKVIVVSATKGEQGEPQPGVLAEGEPLWERRVVELAKACELLGIEPPIFLGYEDSGMMGEPANENPKSFWQAPFDEAVERLAKILNEHEVDVFTIYDPHGLYGHPDHIQVHRVGLAAAQQLGIINVFESTMCREAMTEMMHDTFEDLKAKGVEVPDENDIEEFGVKREDLAFEVDVTDQLGEKKAAIKAHESQIGDNGFFLALDDKQFERAFGTEWFAKPNLTNTGGPEKVDLLPGL